MISLPDYGLGAIAATADFGRSTGFLLLHQIEGIGLSSVDGFSHFHQSRDPVLLFYDWLLVTLLVWVAPLEATPEYATDILAIECQTVSIGQ